MSQAAQWLGADLRLRLHIQPKASRDQIVGLHGDALKVTITAPPVDGKANAHLTKFLAKQFKVAKGQVVIEKGQLGRQKQVLIQAPSMVPKPVEALLNEVPARPSKP